MEKRKNGKIKKQNFIKMEKLKNKKKRKTKKRKTFTF
jgi:hypothetical protein